MSKRYFRKLAALAKIEATYGVDATPTAMANAIRCTDVSFNPLAADKVERNLYFDSLGAQPSLQAGEHIEMSFKVELAGSGTAGVAPAWGPLMRACGMSETIVADTSVTYAPVSAGYESISEYFNLDGVLHQFLGGRGNVKVALTPKQIPYLDFNFMGLLVAAADSALPTSDFSAWQDPLIVSKANTPTWEMHGYAAIGESLTLDLGNKVEMRNLVGEDSVQITDRKGSGSMVIEAPLLAAKDFFAISRARTRGALSVVHGTAAGNIVTIGAPKCEIDPPSYGQTQGIVNLTLPFVPTFDAGDDEISITLT